MKNFKKLRNIGALVLTSTLLTACGHQVDVPPAHVGKLSTESGLQEGLINPSRFKLEKFCIVCDGLILAEASDYGAKESMTIYMPKDQLNLTVDVRGVFTISPDQGNVEQIFARMTADQTHDDRVSIIPMQRVFNTYAQPVIREAVRGTITKYTIAEVMENRDTISAELTQVVRSKLKVTPITTKQFGLADIQPPPVIVTAREKAKEREIAIQQAEANKQVSLKEAEAALEVAIKQQEVDLKEAETQVLVNNKLAEGVNDAFVTQRWLKIWTQIATNPEGKVIIMPAEAMKNPALMMSATNEAFKPTK